MAMHQWRCFAECFKVERGSRPRGRAPILLVFRTLSVRPALFSAFNAMWVLGRSNVGLSLGPHSRPTGITGVAYVLAAAMNFSFCGGGVVFIPSSWDITFTRRGRKCYAVEV